jgi:hypothetical protein
MARKKNTCPFLDSLLRNLENGKNKRRLVLYLYLTLFVGTCPEFC